jgi:rRNA-processing protein FCF1
MIPGSFRVDIFSEIERVMDEPYQICLLDRTVDELNKIFNEQTGKHKAAAKLALSLIKHKKPRILRAKSLNMAADSKNTIVDDSLLSISGEDTIVATQDSELKKKLKSKGAKIIILRGKKHLEIR